ncbi:MAG: c-type cytochrome [Planctomycetia bacterium]
MQQEAKEPIRLFLDGATEPFKVAHPPLRFQFTTLHLPDGPHVLRIEASNGLAPPTIKELPFVVRNGVAISVSGLEENQTIAGQVDVIINAYAGNTEVDFEPKRAETPEPIPTWAWVLLLAVGAWSLAYLLTPVDQDGEDASVRERDLVRMGERVYGDTCARCHGEDGNGAPPRVPMLRDSGKAVAENPYALLSFIVTSAPGSIMPPWGTRLTNEELVAVVNHVRTSWRHDASTIDLVHRSPPPGPFREQVGPDGITRRVERGIRQLESALLTALRERDADVLGQCCFPVGSAPVLFRTDGVFARGATKVAEAWGSYFEALGRGSVTRLQLIDARYAYDPAQFEDRSPLDGAYVIAMGRLFLATKNALGKEETAKGRFIRTYQFFQGNWTLVFDFADIPMNVGCSVDAAAAPECPPDMVPSLLPGVTSPGRANDLGFAEAMQLLKDLKSPGGSSPHGAFWKEMGYAELVKATFEDADEAGTRYRLVWPWNSRESNLVRVLVDGRGCLVQRADGTWARKDVPRMPKGRPPVPAETVERIAAWIDAGCPEVLGTPSTLPREPVPVPAGEGGAAAREPGPGTAPPRDAVPGGSLPAVSSPLGYAGIQAILGSWMSTAGSSPHQKFWELSHAEFLAFRFPRAEGEDGEIQLVVPGDSKASNLLKALRGEPVTVRYADGRREDVSIKRMPPRGKTKPTPEQLEQVARWIDAGCPEQPGSAPVPAAGSGAAPSAGPAAPPAPAPEQPAPGGFPVPAPEQPAPGGFPAPAPEQHAPGGFPAPAPEQPQPGGFPAPAPEQPAPAQAPPSVPLPATPAGPVMGYAEVQALLGAFMKNAGSAPHQQFWELTYAEFLAFRFPRVEGEDGLVQLVVPGDSRNSNLVRALKGEPLWVTYGDGRKAEVPTKRMPPRGKRKPTDEEIARVAVWIDAGCPEQGRP